VGCLQGASSSAVKDQTYFLALLHSTSPNSVVSSSTHTAAPAAPAAAAFAGQWLGSLGLPLPASSSPYGLNSSSTPLAAKVHSCGPGLAAKYATWAAAAALPVPESLDGTRAAALLQQLAGLQQLLKPDSHHQQQQPDGSPPPGGKQGRRSSASKASASGLLACMDRSKLQHLVQQARKAAGQQQQLRRSTGSNISRVSSDLTAMLALSLSTTSSEDAEAASRASDDDSADA
jgi:hypothetical protein